MMTPDVTDEPVALDVPGVRSRRRPAVSGRLSAALGLSAIVAVSAAIRVALASSVSVPTIFPDELGFWELGRGIGESGRWMVGGQPVRGFTYAPLYPLLIAPTHLVTHSLVDAYVVAKVLNGLVMSLAAVPAYFLARRVATVRGSLVSAALAVLVPSAVYTTHVMSESLSYPLFLCAVLAMTAALANVSAKQQLVALAVITLTVLSRTQMVVLYPAFACAIVLLAWIDARWDPAGASWRRLGSFKTTWLVYGIGSLVLVVFALGGSIGPDIRGQILRAVGLNGSVPTGLPSASDLQGLLGPVRPGALPINIVRHLAELDLYSGVIPFAAFLLVAIATLRAGKADRRRSVFVVLGLSAGSWLVALAALYETSFKLHGVLSTHVFDRYDFYVVPLFVIALVAWVEDGLPRPRQATRAVAVTAALLPLLTLPLGLLLYGGGWGTNTSTAGMVPLVWAKDVVGDGWLLRVVLFLVTSALALALLRVRTDRAWLLVGLCTVVFVGSSALVTASNIRLGIRAAENAGGNRLDWVDEAAAPERDVAIVWPGNEENPLPERTALLEAVFFNRSIGPVYDLEGPFVDGFPSTSATLHGEQVVTSAGLPVRASYVLAHRSLRVVGRPIASDSVSGLVLYRVAGPVSLMR